MQIKTIVPIGLLCLFLFSGCEKEIEGPKDIPSASAINLFNQRIESLMTAADVERYGLFITTNKEVIGTVEKGISGDSEVSIGDIANLFYATDVLRDVESDQLRISQQVGSQGTLKELLSFSNLESGKQNYELIKTNISSEKGQDINQSITGLINDLGLSGTTIKEAGISSTPSDLIKFSQAIDNQQLFESEDTHEAMLRPIYKENGERTPTGLGCFISITDDGKLIWAVGQDDKYATLMLKSTTDSLSMIFIAESGKINQPLIDDFGNLLSSPIYQEFQQNLLAPDSLQSGIDWQMDQKALSKALVEAIERGLRDQVYFDLLARIKLFDATGDQSEFTKLTTIYQEVFQKDPPIDVVLSKSKAEITRVSDYLWYQRPFRVDEAEEVKIFATAEYDKQMQLPEWSYDLVEVYFDLNHERTTNFGPDDRQYRFHYDWDKSTGNAPSMEGFEITESETSAGYSLEVKIPRQTLYNSDSVTFSTGMQLGLETMLSDNDGNGQESVLIWNSERGSTPWTNTSTYGTLALVNNVTSRSDTICFAPKTRQEIVLDGKNTGEWNRVPAYSIATEFNERDIDPKDLSGTFRLQWDEDNIYFLLEVNDDYKKKIEEVADFGWITNVKQDTVWFQTREMCEAAGGHPSNYLLSTSTELAAGDYVLHYLTNQSHSFGRWTKERPELSYSGIMVY